VSRCGENGFLSSTNLGSWKKFYQVNPEIFIFKSTNTKKGLIYFRINIKSIVRSKKKTRGLGGKGRREYLHFF